MSPLLVVFAPVVVGGVAFVAILFGAATAGSWEAFEGHPVRRPRAGVKEIESVETSRHSRAHAA